MRAKTQYILSPSRVALLLTALSSQVLADNCGSLSDCYDTLGAAVSAAAGLGLFGMLLSMGLDFLPGIGTVKGVIEGITGRDLVTGEELPWWARVLGVVPGLGAIDNIIRDASKAAAH